MNKITRLSILLILPRSLLRRLPEPDLRRDTDWGMCAVGVFMILLGRFAAFGVLDTRFTATLARIDMEYTWGVIMVASGILQCLAAFTPWRAWQVYTYGWSGLVLMWTYIMTALILGLNTPTVDACLGVGLIMLIATAAKAQQSVMVRSCRRENERGRPEYG